MQEQTEKELFNERLTLKARLDAERRQFGDLYAAEVNAVGGDDLPRVTVELDRCVADVKGSPPKIGLFQGYILDNPWFI